MIYFSYFLLVMPDKKRVKFLSISDKQPPLPSSTQQRKKSYFSNNDPDDKLCVAAEVEQYKHDDRQRQSSTQQSDPTVKVPVFVLHPSGTHYIPMSIDSSVVSHAFKKNSNLSHSSSTADQAQCHPVSIPVNFNPITTFSDSYELDIQNINVIGTRHQTSVRPN
jgi:hypothetical protein